MPAPCFFVNKKCQKCYDISKGKSEVSEVLYRGLLEPLGGMQVKLRTIAREASLTIHREVALDLVVFLYFYAVNLPTISIPHHHLF